MRSARFYAARFWGARFFAATGDVLVPPRVDRGAQRYVPVDGGATRTGALALASRPLAATARRVNVSTERRPSTSSPRRVN
jgi:hypothetical protein